MKMKEEEDGLGRQVRRMSDLCLEKGFEVLAENMLKPTYIAICLPSPGIPLLFIYSHSFFKSPKFKETHFLYFSYNNFYSL